MDGSQKASPLYSRVKTYILEQVNAGQWSEGARLPSEHELMVQFGVSRMTVHRALRELSSEGVIARIQGVGSFVSEAKPQVGLIEIRDIAEEISAHGHQHSARVIQLEAVRASVELANALSQRPGAKLLMSLVVHSEDDVPVQLEQRFVVPSFAPDFLEQDYTRTTAYRYLRGIAPATEVEHVVLAVMPDAAVQELLELEADEPCLRLIRRTFVQETPVTQSVFTYPGARYSLGSRYKINPGGMPI